MKPNFFVRALFALFLFAIIGLSAFAVALDARLLPTPSIASTRSTSNVSLQLYPHQRAANSYQQQLKQLRSTQPAQSQQSDKIVRQQIVKQIVKQIEEQIDEGETLQALDTDLQQRSRISEKVQPMPPSPIVTEPPEASLPEIKPSPYDIIEAALQPGRTYPISLTPPAFAPPRFAQQLPQTLGQMSDRVKEQPIRIIETSKKIQPAVKQRIESASEQVQQIPEKLRNRLSDTLDQIGEKAHKTAEELRDS